MDTVTHGIAGALIGKAVFRGEDMFSSSPINRARIVTWSLMLGAIFPDADMLREFFSRNPMLILTWHRGITHSLVCMPIWALALAALTRGLSRWRKWEAPSFAALTGIYAIGILSHILLDLATSFGTMAWSPLRWSRPAWDLLFIIDLSFTGLLLCPQLLAWVYRQAEGLKNRAIIMWSVLSLISLGIDALLKNVGAPISAQTAVLVIMLLAVFFLLPVLREMGLRVRYATWNRVGLAAAIIYIGCAVYAHRVALDRVEKFVSLFQLKADSFAALPLPPSMWHWDGLVNTPHGVFAVRLDLSESAPLDSIEHRYYPDAFSNRYSDAAKRLPNVQTVLWFARFPVIRFHKEGDDAIVEVSDIRFQSMRRGRTPGFTYRVIMDLSGNVISQGWERD
ncbi:MAG TPA: metal-dependent hydrolase [Candidatus Solibacter sp.]|nr:metal-dependent hydrolase [Candidatus Solibacter sp.]